MLPINFHKKAKEIGEVMQNANKVLIIAHKNPDGDTMGSALSLFEYLKNTKKDVKVFCVDPFVADFAFLPHFEEVGGEFNWQSFDLIITVDCGAHYMTGVHDAVPELFDGKTALLNIDHHPSNNNFGKWNLVDTSASATTLILTEIFQFLEIPITYQMATNLLCGLFTDTGSFQHSNTDPRTLRAAAYLVKRGAALNKIGKNIFKTYKLEVLRLWGRVLSRAYRNDKGITISHVSDKDFAETKTTAPDLSGVIDYLNSVPESRFSMLLTENDGKVKGSFRTLRDDIDVAKIAGIFGGGGHKKAAGFTLSGKLQKEVRWKIVQK